MRSIAQLAESRVCKWLERRGWVTLKRNYRGAGFELDLISISDNTLLIGEVKCRPLLYCPTTINPYELVRPKQRAAIKRGILHFIERYDPLFSTIRVDLFVVSGEKLSTLTRYKSIDML